MKLYPFLLLTWFESHLKKAKDAYDILLHLFCSFKSVANVLFLSPLVYTIYIVYSHPMLQI